MIRVLLFVIYILASLTLGSLAGLYQGLSAGVFCASIAFLLILQIDAAVLRRLDRKSHKAAIAGLKRSGAAMEKALAETRAKMEEVTKAVEARATAQSRKIVSELQVLESLMREFAGRISDKAKNEPVEDAPFERAVQAPMKSYLSGLGEPELLETIRASLEENRVDLYLQPIVSLPQRKLRFYEALSRLRAEDGSVIMPAQYIKVAAPAGLMSIVDNLLLFRCVQIVRKLTVKNRGIGVFCNISGDTLRDAEFFPQFLEYMHNNRDLSGQIVFEFDQGAVLKAGPEGEANLNYLAGLGFALSMDHVETLALDFGKLKNMGFKHLKVRAETLIGGMGPAQADVAAEDIKKLLERHGVNLIAERVEDEKTVVQLLDYAVDFAQGYLFGEPRAVRDDAIKPAEKTDPPAPIIPFRRVG
ncbi:MAG: EAL domain-containing protein [Alphaproteobacteria bacterium]|nr:EAL domain-containing protein [Alphaproteobacteria bacterium]MDE2629770.1 EAL domain-containing protein [Alphaproteobacteria bacterium]